MADLRDILSENDGHVTEEELIKYLNAEVSEEERYAIEKKITANAFDFDAVHGLAQIQDKESLAKHIGQLKGRLAQLTGKARKQKPEIRILEWVILAILIVLFVCVISFVVINLQHRLQHHSSVGHGEFVAGSIASVNSNYVTRFNLQILISRWLNLRAAL